ncbi:MAG: tRNA (guanine-N1)-methyltransferase [Flavobacteriaceae bacterium]
MKGFSTIAMILALIVLPAQWVQGQQEEESQLSLDGGTIDSQFEYLFKRSGNYNADGKRYEVVRLINLNKIRKNVLDTINEANKNAAELKSTITTHETSIAELNKQLENTKNNLNSVTEEKDSISLLGAMVSKSTYNFILWTVIAGLLMLLLLFIYKFRNSNFLTQEAKSKLSDLEVEYENHRRRALEREQKISRQLQDEINKYKKTN